MSRAFLLAGGLLALAAYVLNLVSAGPNAPPGMAAMFPDSGKYVIYWHKVDGRWLMMDDIAVTSINRAPPPPAQPARRR